MMKSIIFIFFLVNSLIINAQKNSILQLSEIRNQNDSIIFKMDDKKQIDLILTGNYKVRFKKNENIYHKIRLDFKNLSSDTIINVESITFYLYHKIGQIEPAFYIGAQENILLNFRNSEVFMFLYRYIVGQKVIEFNINDDSIQLKLENNCSLIVLKRNFN